MSRQLRFIKDKNGKKEEGRREIGEAALPFERLCEFNDLLEVRRYALLSSFLFSFYERIGAAYRLPPPSPRQNKAIRPRPPPPKPPM